MPPSSERAVSWMGRLGGGSLVPVIGDLDKTSAEMHPKDRSAPLQPFPANAAVLESGRMIQVRLWPTATSGCPCEQRMGDQLGSLPARAASIAGSAVTNPRR